MKKLTILLLILTLLFQLTACVTPDDTSAETTEKPIPDNIPPDLPARFAEFYDPEGDALVEFIYVEGGSGTYVADSLEVDPDSGDLDDIDMSVIERNNVVNELLGVKVDAFTDETLGVDQLHVLAKIYFDSQDPTLDVYVGVQYYDLSVAASGHLLNLDTLKACDDKPIIDIKQEYWATEYIKEINPGGATYFVTGDLAIPYLGGFYCTFINERLYEDFVQEHYDYRSIEDIIKSGDFTLQTALDMANLVYDDTDKSETPTPADRLGIVFEPGYALDGFAYSCNLSFSKRTVDQSGKESIAFTLATDPNLPSLSSLLNTLTHSDAVYRCPDDQRGKTAMEIYAAGNTLMVFGTLLDSHRYLGDEKTINHIAPYPKLNKNQTAYYTAMDETVPIYGISRYSDCPRFAAATLELMAYKSAHLVANPLYSKTIYGCRCSRHEIQEEMIGLLRQSLTTDFVAAWSYSLDGVSHFLRDPDQYTAMSDYVKEHYPNVETQLDQLTEKLENAVKK